MPASKKNDTPDTFSVGVNAGAALGVGPVSSVGFAMPYNDDAFAGFFLGVGVTMGISAGAAAGVELGLWWDDVHNLGGEFWSIEISYAIQGGYTIGVAFNYQCQFLGFVIVPQFGTEVDIHYTRGITYVIHKWLPPGDDNPNKD